MGLLCDQGSRQLRRDLRAQSWQILDPPPRSRFQCARRPGRSHVCHAVSMRAWRSLYDLGVRAIAFQAIILALLGLLIAFLAVNAVANLRHQGIAGGFDFLTREAGFEISPALIPYTPADSYGKALLVGLLNTGLVSMVAIVFATILGVVIGILRLSGNWLARNLTLSYVELMRNTPLLLQLVVWWDLLRLSAPGPREAWQILPHLFVSN